MRILNLRDIEEIRQDPLKAAQQIQQLREDIESVLVTIERGESETTEVRAQLASNIVHNLRQRYPKDGS